LQRKIFERKYANLFGEKWRGWEKKIDKSTKIYNIFSTYATK